MTQTQKDGTKTSFGYAPNDTMLEQTTTVDGIENTNTFGYTLDLLTSLKHNNFAVGYDYDNQGRITKIKIADNEYLTKEYVDNQEITRYATGEIYRQTFDNNGNVVQTHYTPKPTAENANPSEILLSTNVYDIYGNLAEVKDKSSGSENITTIDIDKFGKTTKVTNVQHGADVVIENVYDENQTNISETKFSLNSDIYSYTYSYEDNPDAKLKNITLKHNDNENNIFSQGVTYDNLDRLSSLITKNHSRQFTYLKSGDHTTNLVSMLQFGYGNINTENLKYKYDEKGNISEIRKNGLLVARYKYDGLSRLVREDNTDFKKTYVFDYDTGGNISSKLEYNFTLVENLDYEDVVHTYNYSYPTTGWRDQLTEFNGQKIENYDALGNPWVYKDNNLEWSHGRQLDKFADVEFTYNGSDIRTSKIANGFTTKYYLNGNKIIRQYDELNILDFYYGTDGITGFHIVIKNNNKTIIHEGDYYYKKNLQGDIIGIIDSSGEQIIEYVYDAWGNHKAFDAKTNDPLDISKIDSYTNIENIVQNIAIKNPFRYRSYYYDFETKLYYLNSRYYDPLTGRFINVDDINYLDKDEINGLKEL